LLLLLLLAVVLLLLDDKTSRALFVRFGDGCVSERVDWRGRSEVICCLGRSVMS
jgi:hypothetical protein